MSTNELFESPVLTDDEFFIMQSFSGIQRMASPFRLQHGYICICQEGNAEMILNMQHQVLIKNKLLILFPHEVVTLLNVSDDFSFIGFRLSPEFMTDILFRFPPSFIGFIKENFSHQMPEDDFQLFYNNMYRVLLFRYEDKSNICRREIIANQLRNFFLDTYDKIKRYENLSNSNRSRKTQIMEEFCDLVMKNYKVNREVSFYADKLFITPKYLSMILKEMDVHNRSAKEWIDSYIITEIQLRLKSTGLSILEISNDFHFPSLSYFCKYFKSHVGLTPKEYRRGAVR